MSKNGVQPATEVFQTIMSSVVMSDLDAERGLLAAVIIDNKWFIRVGDLIHADSFSSYVNKLLWKIIAALMHHNQPVDLITLTAELKRLGDLDDVGADYLNDLLAYGSDAHTLSYAHIVNEHYRRRAALGLLNETAQALVTSPDRVETILSKLEQTIVRLLEVRQQERVTLRDVVREHVKQALHNMEHEVIATGILSGIAELDDLLGGFNIDEFYVVAGRPGSGKSTALLQFLLAAYLQGCRVLFYSIEMSHKQLGKRITGMLARVNNQHLRTGHYSPQDVARLQKLSDRMEQGNVDDRFIIGMTQTLTPIHLRQQVMREHQLFPDDQMIVGVDYVQLMDVDRHVRSENRTQQLSYISRQLKTLAGVIPCPVLTAAQLNREVDKRTNKRPKMSDLRESGSLEQDADVVLGLYSDDYYNNPSKPIHSTEILVLKNRNGGTGKVDTQFDKSVTTFFDSDDRVASWEQFLSSERLEQMELVSDDGTDTVDS